MSHYHDFKHRNSLHRFLGPTWMPLAPRGCIAIPIHIDEEKLAHPDET
jgi:hypothetical protein